MDIVVRWQAAPSAPIDPTSLSTENWDETIPVLDAGAVLEAGGVYLDLSQAGRGPFRALAGQIAGTGNRYVAQRDVSCETWCHLVRTAARADANGLHEVDCFNLHDDVPVRRSPDPAPGVAPI